MFWLFQPSAAGNSSTPSRLPGIDDPRCVELIYEHAEPLRPEGLLKWHLYHALLRECVEHALSIGDIVEM